MNASRSPWGLSADEGLESGVFPSGRIEVRRLSRSDQRALVRDLRMLDDILLDLVRASIRVDGIEPLVAA